MPKNPKLVTTCNPNGTFSDITLLDLFARDVLRGFMPMFLKYYTEEDLSLLEEDEDYQNLARHCYKIADAMLAERERREGGE